jgi:SET domain
MPNLESYIKCGECLEPFAALINHSCEPNALCAFEGKELRIRALQDIAAGQEITLRYFGDYDDYDKQRDVLLQVWSFQCACAFCDQGNSSLPEGIRKQLQVLETRQNKMLKDKYPPDRQAALVELGRSIQAMEESGFGHGIPWLLIAYQKATEILVQKRQFIDALKYSLKTRYFIETFQKPALPLQHRLTTLFNIILLLQLQSSNEAAEAIAISDSVLVHLKAAYVRDIEKCFGSDSLVFAHETSSFRNFLASLVKNGGKRYVPLELSEAEKDLFVLNMNKLLEWAGLRELTSEQLLECL